MIRIPGEEGFSLVTYIGRAKTAKLWPGPVTEVLYTLGGDITTALVDCRDAALFSDKVFEVTAATAFVVDDDTQVPVSIMSIRGASVLVRRPDVLACCYVPRFTVDTGPFPLNRAKDPHVPLSIFDLAIPYGEDWEKVFSSGKLDAARFNHDLKMAGVWTVDDYNARPNTVCRIIDQMLGLSDAVASQGDKK